MTVAAGKSSEIEVTCPQKDCKGTVKINVTINNFKKDADTNEKDGKGYKLSDTVSQDVKCSTCSKECTVSFEAAVTVKPKSD